MLDDKGNVKVYVIVINNGHSHPADNVDAKRTEHPGNFRPGKSGVFGFMCH